MAGWTLNLRASIPTKMPTDSGLILNGELYNDEYFAPEISDTEILSNSSSSLTAFIENLQNITGPFSVVKFFETCRQLIFARDRFGRRSLMIANNEDGIFLSSVALKIYNLKMNNWAELKSGEILSIEIEPASNNRLSVNKLKDISPKFTLVNHSIPHEIPTLETPGDYYASLAKDVNNILKKSVLARVKKNQSVWEQVSVFFSGGLDSTLLAYYLSNISEIKQVELVNINFWTKHSGYDTPDKKHVYAYEELKKLSDNNNLKLKIVDVPSDVFISSAEIIPSLLYPKLTVLDDSLGSALWFLSKYSSNKVVFSGLGADELFGGYRRHLKAADLDQELLLDINRIGERNLARDDRMISDHGREVRLPFLDEDLVKFVTSLPSLARVRPDHKNPVDIGAKFLLRLVAFNNGLIETCTRAKQAMQFGSRSAKAANTDIHKKVRNADSTISPRFLNFKF